MKYFIVGNWAACQKVDFQGFSPFPCLFNTTLSVAYRAKSPRLPFSLNSPWLSIPQAAAWPWGWRMGSRPGFRSSPGHTSILGLTSSLGHKSSPGLTSIPGHTSPSKPRCDPGSAGGLSGPVSEPLRVSAGSSACGAEAGSRPSGDCVACSLGPAPLVPAVGGYTCVWCCVSRKGRWRWP